MAGLPIVVVPHPLGGLRPDEVHRKAEGAVQEIARVLTSPSAQLTKEFSEREFPIAKSAIRAKQIFS